jgi:hypothetical protein
MLDQEIQELREIENAVQIDDARTQEGDSEVAPIGYVISSYGADYTVDGLVKRMREGFRWLALLEYGHMEYGVVESATVFILEFLVGLTVKCAIDTAPSTAKTKQRTVALTFLPTTPPNTLPARA